MISSTEAPAAAPAPSADTPAAGTPAQPSSEAVPPVFPGPRDVVSSTQRRRPWLIGGAIAGAIVLVAAAVGVTLVLTSNDGPSYADQAGQTLQPMLTDNERIASTVNTLTASTNVDHLKTVLSNAQSDAKAADRQITDLDVKKPDPTLSGQVHAAIAAEQQWLDTAVIAVSSPADPQVSQLTSLGIDAQSKLHVLVVSIPKVAGYSFPSSPKIVSYASAVTSSGLTKLANVLYVNQVSALLDQSSSSFQSVNDFFGQLQTVVNGGEASFTLAQAEQQITSIIANRTSLAASAQALSSPSPEAQNVTRLLVAAFNASLKDDTDLADCLNQENYGDIAFIYQSCLSSTVSDSSAATTAKQDFLAAYNQLRTNVGQPTINPQF